MARVGGVRTARVQGAGVRRARGPEPPRRRRRDRHAHAGRRRPWAALRRRRRDHRRRPAADSPRALRPPGDQELPPGSEGLRQAQPPDRAARPLQPRGRVPHERRLPPRLRRADQREPRGLRQAGRQGRLAAGLGRRAPPHRAAARRLHGRRRQQAVHDRHLLRDRDRDARGPPASDVRWPVARGRRHGRHVHVHDLGRARSRRQRRRRRPVEAGIDRVPLPRVAEPEPAGQRGRYRPRRSTAA